ncbi:hypothetical protein PR048_008442 [Dryococelus australis]|uniref:HAT C-terminal dimerisation domain-containing protein n=1 Tax=Dryococelus australis TaxID=614101 RepID=A0ABQ9HX50_9NEOP|nr:hypothetical protein PR048_008442 [Dryococelus australis]
MSKCKGSGIAFDGVWDEVEHKIEDMDLSKPTLPSIRILPKRLEQAQNLAVVHKFVSVKQYYRKNYYKFLDNIIDEIEDSLDLRNTSTWKILLLAPASLDEPTLTTISSFGIAVAKLKQEKEFIAHLIQTPKSIEDYVNGFKQMHPESKSLFPQLHVLLRLRLVVPATSSTAERSFPMLRTINTYLRSTITHKRMNHLCVITSYPESLEATNISQTMSEFIIANSYRCKVFGKVVA